MKRLANTAAAFAALVLSTSMSCKDSATNSSNKADTTPCRDVACTEIFMMVTANIIDRTGEPAILDSYYTIQNESGERIRHEQSSRDGYYTILDDTYQKNLVNKTATFRFLGFKHGKEVVNEPYTISADCCHIKKESGREQIALQ